MNNLPESPQYIVSESVPSKTRPGKTDKFPCNMVGVKASIHDQSNWMTYEQANLMSQTLSQNGSNYGVGFVFKEDDQYFFIDLDNCLQPDGQCSQVAMEIMAMFPGAYIEVSQSGKGLHIIGQYTGPPPNHKCKNTQLGIELYTSNRFVALGDISTAKGNANTDHTTALNLLIVKYFINDSASVGNTPAQWTTSHNQNSNPIKDDSEIIAKACASQSMGAALGGKAGFNDLWTAKGEVLGNSYPDEYGKRDYDSSSADMALAMSLIWWTGGNCERTEQLMRQSALNRPKWDKHKSYLKDTILKAHSRVNDHYGQAATTTDYTGQPFITVQMLPDYFKGVVYVAAQNEYFVPGYNQLVKPPSFNGIKGNKIFDLDDSPNPKTTRTPVKAFHENTYIKLPQVQTTIFDPSHPYGAIVMTDTGEAVNMCKLPEIKTSDGEASLFVNHVKKMLPDEYDQMILLSYLASIVQNPGRKIRWCPVLIGCPGNGKSTFSVIIALILGYSLCHTLKVNELGHNGSKVFNKWMTHKIFATLEEINTGDRVEVQQSILTWITNDVINVEGKGIDDCSAKNVTNFIAYSNSETAVWIDEDDRRYGVLFTAVPFRSFI